MTTIARVLGCAMLGLSTAGLAAGPSAGPVALDASQMDRVTAGTLTFGPTAAALSESFADANGNLVHTVTSSKTLTNKTIPEGLPAIAATYMTSTSGASIALAVGGEAPSKSTSVSGVNQQPVPNVIGRSASYTLTGHNLEITVESSMYFGSLAFRGFITP
ncbi:hypothetical protein CKO15_07210 [Halorhodospira abdelmalekii]|uniref:hypothetical protein n=1 Tax=Halorhodospira abdelmalekii TaxID=421629 RepID=UPI0019055AF5|nr:hypothetical protein [Halorhodospira abdelmalekii]MBK1735076.1 hypothetical protein [Halorhodospira abdelmalekii]